ncbi:MAG TPA: hypothetical protein PKA16_00975 [Ottowia sp.]|uniref:hypothetical protein n=1 Tax=Ottowia sp. TaxID=1898956 RepID=UPI002CAA9EA7|nr:hypothetical protein [Ottowia sp.]HMN19944.1 hypothetical protein [Ottowia sp.]
MNGSTEARAARRRRAARRSSFRSVRVLEGELVRQLRSRRSLWLHGWLMGLLTLLATWAVSTLLMRWGVSSLALRYALALGAGYLVYLGLLRLWAGVLLQPDERRDAANPDIDPGWSGGGEPGCADDLLASGGGGDFGGGGASGAFEALADGATLGDAASGTLDVAASADEGAVVVIPVLAVFGLVLAALLGAGSLLLLYFGSEALLAVALEVAFSWTAARTVVRVEREGWLAAALRLTWKPLLGALLAAVVLGGLLDLLLPQAHSLPAAIAAWRAR